MKQMPVYKLSRNQTAQLKAIWTPIRRNQLIEDRKSAPIWVRLTEPEATLTKGQLFAAATILADLELPIPPFVHELLNQY